MTPSFVFEGGQAKCMGFAQACEQVCTELGCYFFDAGLVASSSPLDGVHLDAPQHIAVGRAIATIVATVPAGGAR